MNVARNEEFEQKFVNSLLSQSYERKGIHQTDVTFCLLKAYFRKTGAEKTASVKGEISKKLGQAHHIISEVMEGYTKEKKIEWNGIYCSLDMFGDVPVEIKTTRKFPAKKGEEEQINEAYIEQMKAYCVASGTKKAILLVIYMIPATVKAFTIKFTEKELKEKAEKMLKNKHLLENALFHKDPTILLKTSPAFDWECKYCEFQKICPKANAKQKKEAKEK